MPATERDWSAYNKKRKRDLERLIEQAKNVLDEVGPPVPEPLPAGRRGPGRPAYSSRAMLLANLMRIYLKMSYRDLETFLRTNPSMRRRLGLHDPPGRDTLHRYASLLSESYLERFNTRLTMHLKKTRADSELPSTPRASRSRGTRDAGAIPRTRRKTARNG